MSSISAESIAAWTDDEQDELSSISTATEGSDRESVHDSPAPPATPATQNAVQEDEPPMMAVCDIVAAVLKQKKIWREQFKFRKLAATVH